VIWNRGGAVLLGSLLVGLGGMSCGSSDDARVAPDTVVLLAQESAGPGVLGMAAVFRFAAGAWERSVFPEDFPIYTSAGLTVSATGTLWAFPGSEIGRRPALLRSDDQGRTWRDASALLEGFRTVFGQTVTTITDLVAFPSDTLWISHGLIAEGPDVGIGVIRGSAEIGGFREVPLRDPPFSPLPEIRLGIRDGHVEVLRRPAIIPRFNANEDDQAIVEFLDGSGTSLDLGPLGFSIQDYSTVGSQGWAIGTQRDNTLILHVSSEEVVEQFRSSDPRLFPNYSGARAIDMHDGLHGIACGTEDCVYTRDGGRSWLPGDVDAALKRSGRRYVIQDAVSLARDAGFAAALSVDPDAGSCALFLSSQDGGATWTEVSGPPEPSSCILPIALASVP
jgi:hypothetical protein